VLRSHGIALLDVRSDVYWNAGHPFASDGLFDVQREPGGSVADPGLAPAADEPWSQRLAVIPTRAGRDAALTLAGPGAVNDDWFGRRRPAGLRSDVGAIETDATARAAAASPAWPSTLPSPPATPTLSSAAPPPTAASAQAVARAVGRRLSAIAVFAFATLTLARRRRRVSARSVPPPPESLAWGS
jgi:hypothetical protein